ncbi:hypothetical protein B0A62_10960 [Flavobacterium hydatis]|uniref:Uncharacterized protein n=1 Tax=Flavobacterium hydatis TaxID=991 RepID=A0A086A945_FLAHY|nr:hypothetical protein IW20_18105 [Flavobacterium hydatis]OXA94171.1 hypothetical protein B0A62_10960 [Flavobacterium hydatis]
MTILILKYKYIPIGIIFNLFGGNFFCTLFACGKLTAEFAKFYAKVTKFLLDAVILSGVEESLEIE